MTDIVEKLTIWPAADSADALAGHFVESLMQEAAAEITKLRAEKEDLLNAAEHFRAERDAAAQEASMLRQIVHDMTDGITANMDEAERRGIAVTAARTERERCAKVAETFFTPNILEHVGTKQAIAAEIRSLPDSAAPADPMIATEGDSQ